LRQKNVKLFLKKFSGWLVGNGRTACGKFVGFGCLLWDGGFEARLPLVVVAYLCGVIR
jgi:hypothetical protein